MLVCRWLFAATVKGWNGDLLPSTFWAGGGLSSAGRNTWALGCCGQMRATEKEARPWSWKSASYQSLGWVGTCLAEGAVELPEF